MMGLMILVANSTFASDTFKSLINSRSRIMSFVGVLFSPLWLSIGFGLALALVTYVYHSLCRRRFVKPFDSLPTPQGPGFHLLYGHLPYLNPDFQEAQRWVSVDSADKNGRTGYWHVFSPGLSVSHWEDARQVLMVEEYREPIKILDKHLKQFLGYNNLLILHGKVWKHHRSAIAKTFTPTGLASYKEAMVKVVDTMCKSLLHKIDSLDDKCYETKVEPLMKMITMDVFGLAAFSCDFGSSKTLVSSPFATAFDTLAAGMTTRFNTNPLRPSNYFYSYPTELNRQHKESQTLLREFLVEQVRQRHAGTVTFANGKRDLLAYMCDAHESSKDKDESVAAESTNVDEVLTDIMMTLLFAGYDTTSITLSYALYLVSQDNQAYERCLKEIDACTDLIDTDKLQYCHAVVREALRLFPPAPATLRKLRKDVTLHDGFVVPMGTTVYIPIWMIQRLEHNFERGNDFIPERWVVMNKQGTWVERDSTTTGPDGDVPAANMHAFFTFSGGARNCPGGRFALQEATIVLAGLLKHLRFDTLPNYKLLPGKVAVVQHPDDCLPMRITRREKK
ncbi:hypothetical protein MPSEU_000648400 [Mayamaea pseudoterrestris]|nr:hypothetical protein MPSEU_000648400 [Mayamaea pseudoterrestris]